MIEAAQKAVDAWKAWRGNMAYSPSLGWLEAMRELEAALRQIPEAKEVSQ